MASSCEKLDQLVKDYLLFRGFTGTLKMLDQELKSDKDKGLRVDRMMDYIWTLLAAYDLTGLREYWRYLNQRLFSRLDQRYTPSVRKLESSLFKLYVVNAHQCGKQDKVRTFFEQMGPELQSHPDFKDWFAFPFISNPAENPVFSVYFNKQWQDTLQLSLHNFLSVVLQAMPVPTLLNVEFDARRMKNLQEENTQLKEKLRNYNAISTQPIKELRSGSRRNIQTEFNPPTSPPDMVYDFSGLSEDVESSTQEKQKTTRRFPLSLTSPLSGRKKSEPTPQKSKIASLHMPTPAMTSVSATTSTNTVSKAKNTELSTFPPDSLKIPANGKRPSLIAANQIHISARQGQWPITSTGNSPIPIRKLTSVSTSSTVTEETMEAQRSTVTNRSISSPGDTRSPKTKAKVIVPRQSSDGMIESGKSFAMKSYPTGFSEHNDYKGTTSKEEVGQLELSVEENVDIESPFLLLEDEYMEHHSTVSFCQFGPTGQYVASLDMDGIVKVWMWSPQPATCATIMSKSAFLSLAWFNKTERFLLLGNKSGSIRMFDVKESKTHKEIQTHPDNPPDCLRVNDISISPSNNQFVCATSNLCPFTSTVNTLNGKLLQWDMKTWKVERALLVNSDTCNVVTCSNFSSSRHLITGGADGYIRLYDQTQNKPTIKWRAHDSPIQTLQFQGKDSIYSMDAKGKLCEWALSQPGQIINSLNIGDSPVLKLNSGRSHSRLFSFDKEGQYLLTYKGKKGVIYKTQEYSSPACVMELKSHLQPVVTVDWSPSLDTRVCLTGSVDGRVKISTLLSK